MCTKYIVTIKIIAIHIKELEILLKNWATLKTSYIPRQIRVAQRLSTDLSTDIVDYFTLDFSCKFILLTLCIDSSRQRNLLI